MKNFILIAFLVSANITSFTSQLMAQEKKPVLNHIALYVVDLKKSNHFYREVLQLDTIPEPFKDGKHTWLKIGPQSSLHLIEGAKESRNHPINSHVCFSVESVESFISRLEKYKINYTNAKGESKLVTTRVDGVKQIYMQDPDGYWVEINDDKKY
jgi:lactoylglutathione lyase